MNTVKLSADTFGKKLTDKNVLCDDGAWVGACDFFRCVIVIPLGVTWDECKFHECKFEVQETFTASGCDFIRCKMPVIGETRAHACALIQCKIPSVSAGSRSTYSHSFFENCDYAEKAAILAPSGNKNIVNLQRGHHVRPVYMFVGSHVNFWDCEFANH